MKKLFLILSISFVENATLSQQDLGEFTIINNTPATFNWASVLNSQNLRESYPITIAANSSQKIKLKYNNAEVSTNVGIGAGPNIGQFDPNECRYEFRSQILNVVRNSTIIINPTNQCKLEQQLPVPAKWCQCGVSVERR